MAMSSRLLFSLRFLGAKNSPFSSSCQHHFIKHTTLRDTKWQTSLNFQRRWVQSNSEKAGKSSTTETETPLPKKEEGKPILEPIQFEQEQALLIKDQMKHLEKIPRSAAIATAITVLPLLVAGAGILYFPPINFVLAQKLTSMQLTYGAMYTSFFASSHFAFASINYTSPHTTLLAKPFSSPPSSRGMQYAMGIIPAIGVWGCLFLPPVYSYSALMIGITSCFVSDVFFSRAGYTPAWWVRLRYKATLAALLGVGAAFMVIQQ